jgi:hypothetical protein
MICVPENTNMAHAPAPADRFRFRDSIFLLTIASLAIVCGALSLYMQNVERARLVGSIATDDRPSIPLPAGPRKYQ